MPGSPISRGLRSRPSVDNITSKRSPMAIEQHALYFRRDNEMEGTSGFAKNGDSYKFRARSFSKGTRDRIQNQPRISTVVGAAKQHHAGSHKQLPFGSFNRVPNVNQFAYDRPSTNKFDNTYLSAFGHTNKRASASPTMRSSGRKTFQSTRGKVRQGKGGGETTGGGVTGRGQPVSVDTASSLFDSATGMKLQMLKMVRDLNTNQDRSDSARVILRDLGSDPNADHVDEAIFVPFYTTVQDVKENVGQELSEVRGEVRDIFAMLDSDRQLMEDDLDEMEKETREMQRVVTKMDGVVSGIEATLFRGGQDRMQLLQTQMQ